MLGCFEAQLPRHRALFFLLYILVLLILVSSPPLHRGRLPPDLLAVSAMPSAQPMPCFSKTYGDDANPREGFAAVMTCSSADRGCPVVYGAAGRFTIPYIDPKVSDGTPKEAATYDARLRQIGTEMLYVMGQVAERVKR